MEIEIGYGHTPQRLKVPSSRILDILYPNQVSTSITGPVMVQKALSSPIGSPPLSEIVKGRQKIVIITSDITRPMPSYLVLPILIQELEDAGIQRSQITIVFALGSHRRHTEEEKQQLAGKDIYDSIRCEDSSESDFLHMGTTSMGTPVDICRTVAEADCRICLGNIEYHYFAGYSGGAKAIMPGVSTRSAIQSNHSHMIEAAACAGKLEGNPIRMDLEEAIRFCPVDFIVNVVLDEHKKIIYAVCGDIIKAHRKGCLFLDKLYRKSLQKLADIVIVSQGGAPKDLNLYQTQKALDNAKHAVRPGGIIILVGACPEGLGEKTFEEWMTSSHSPDELISRIKTDFQLGGHKATAIAMVLKKSRIFLVSEIPEKLVKSIYLEPFSSVQAAYEAAAAILGQNASVLIMPYGGSTFPVLTQQDNI